MHLLYIETQSERQRERQRCIGNYVEEIMGNCNFYTPLYCYIAPGPYYVLLAIDSLRSATDTGATSSGYLTKLEAQPA